MTTSILHSPPPLRSEMNNEDCIIVSPGNAHDLTSQPPEEVCRVPTGIAPLDAKLGGGTRAGSFNVICGYTGDGKSSLVVHLAQTAAALGHPVRIYHHEMISEEYLRRLKSWESGMAYSKISGVNPKNFPLIEIVSLRSNKHCGVPVIAADIRTLKAKHDRKPVIMIDSLDGLECDRFRLEGLAQSLAELAEEENVVIYATSQANAQVTTVTMKHLRETAGKAFPCSLFIGIGMSKTEDEGCDVVLTIDKNRYGPKFQIRARVDWTCQRFSDVDDCYQIPETANLPATRQI
jgi:archaellum biogenesis ATPase FlaH